MEAVNQNSGLPICADFSFSGLRPKALSTSVTSRQASGHFHPARRAFDPPRTWRAIFLRALHSLNSKDAAIQRSWGPQKRRNILRAEQTHCGHFWHSCSRGECAGRRRCCGEQVQRDLRGRHEHRSHVHAGDHHPFRHTGQCGTTVLSTF